MDDSHYPRRSRHVQHGRNRREARDNVLDALREMLAAPVEMRQGSTREDVSIMLELARGHERGHDR